MQYCGKSILYECRGKECDLYTKPYTDLPRIIYKYCFIKIPGAIRKLSSLK